MYEEMSEHLPNNFGSRLKQSKSADPQTNRIYAALDDDLRAPFTGAVALAIALTLAAKSSLAI